MGKTFNRDKSGYSGWIIISIITILILSTIFIGQFFKSEEKIKLAFKNGQIVSFLTLVTNEDNIIKGCFVLFFHPKTNRCAVISILPKTYIHFGNKHGYLTIEEALKKNISHEDYLEGISKLIGYDITYYIFVEKENLVKLIDIAGGVKIYSDGYKYPSLKVNIPEGSILLDGDKSIEFLSFIIDEETNAEYKQLNRILDYINGLLILKSSFFDGLNDKILVNHLYRKIKTNISISEFLIIYKELLEKNKEGITDYSKGMKRIILYCDKKSIAGYEYIYMPKKSGDWIKREVIEAIDILGEYYKDYDDQRMVIEILNGTDISGLASRARNYILSYGFNISKIENAEREDYENTMLIVYRNEQEAKKLADLINCKKIVYGEEVEEINADVTLILGKDFDGRLVR
jgi:polyisoprenyl-teichoic acid--peptidoglycan teichoic acid transferase